ncbi:YncE family protein [Streptomyces caniferus]|uniref:YncE family protein n=1 Tax=Streptomyces caniferus TaxID=285557 RepID=UPI002E352FE2|nr:YncE family protein [Streptomyces caniferus]
MRHAATQLHYGAGRLTDRAGARKPWAAERAPGRRSRGSRGGRFHLPAGWGKGGYRTKWAAHPSSGWAARRVCVTCELRCGVWCPGEGSADPVLFPNGTNRTEGDPDLRGPDEYQRSVTVAGAAADVSPLRPGGVGGHGGGGERAGGDARLPGDHEHPRRHQPGRAGVIPNGDLYVTNSGSNNVQTIDTATDTVIGAAIPTGTTPVWLTVAPNGNASVANINSSNVTVINTVSDTVVGAPIPVGTNPWGITAGADGHVYTANRGSNGVTVIDSVTNTSSAPRSPSAASPSPWSSPPTTRSTPPTSPEPTSPSSSSTRRSPASAPTAGPSPAARR